MSVFNELKRHREQGGWAYSNSYDRSNTSSNLYNSSPALDKWPSVPQACVSAAGPVDNCVQEIKSSDTDSDEVLLVDDPGVIRVPSTPSQQRHSVSSIYHNSFGNHSPHGLSHDCHSPHGLPHDCHSPHGLSHDCHNQSQLLQQLQHPVRHPGQSAYFQPPPQHQPANARAKQHMQLPVSVVVDQSLLSHSKNPQQHSSQLHRMVMEHHQSAKSQAQSMHLQGNVHMDLHQQPGGASQNHLRNNSPCFQNLEHTPHQQRGTSNTADAGPPHSIVRHTLQHGFEDYPHQRQGLPGLGQHLQASVPHSTYGKQQMVTFHNASGVGSSLKQTETTDEDVQRVKVVEGGFVSHGEQQQSGGSFPQHHNPHHSAGSKGDGHTPSSLASDASNQVNIVDATTNEIYQVPGGELKVNMVYDLKDKTGVSRRARWDGRRMSPLHFTSAVSQDQRPSQPHCLDSAWDSQPQSLESGQPLGHGRETPNSTAGLQPPQNHFSGQPVVSPAVLQLVEDNQPLKPVPRRSATNEIWPTPMPSRKTSNNEDATKETREASPEAADLHLSTDSLSSVESQVVEVSPPLPPNKKEAKPQKDSSLALPKVCIPQITELETNSARIKRKLKEGEEAYAVCRYCGYTGSNVDVCEGCTRRLPSDVKICIKKRRSEAEAVEPLLAGPERGDMSTASALVDKKSFYGNKLKMQAAAFGNTVEEFTQEFDVKSKKQQRARKLPTTPRNIGRGRRIREAMKEPITVILSSDDEEVPKTDSTPAANSGNVSAASLQEDDEMPFFPSQASKPSTFGKSRRERMLDESGRSQVSRSPVSVDEPEVRVEAPLLMNVRGVRVGTMRTSALSVDLLANTIHFTVNSDRTGEDLEFDVFVAELEWIKFTLNPTQPICFLRVSPACGTRLRERLKMSLKSPEYFDPGSQDLKRNLIVVIIEQVLNEHGLREMLELYEQAHPENQNFLTEIDYDSANTILVKSTPPVLSTPDIERKLSVFKKSTGASLGVCSPSPISLSSSQCSGDYGDGSMLEESADMVTHRRLLTDTGVESPCAGNKEEASRSPSPRIGFVGPVEKLLTYPPPPAKGGITITNEDLFCLNEGEFLNDVILDFYLKYLFREKLCEEDQKRTHIFSSFFYKRLMQRQSRSLQEASDVKLTPAQRRHSRVKTWTRHVDIFEKDYLLIPINEHSHWFLAVICFPGLPSIEFQAFEPISPALEDSASDGASENGNSKLSASPPIQEEGPASVGGDEGREELMDTAETASPSSSTNSNSRSILGKVIPGAAPENSDQNISIGTKQPCILILDSLAGPSRNSVIKILKEYLQVEWDSKKKTPRAFSRTVRGSVPKVPQQTNYSDCGVFVLQYAQSFFESPICHFAVPMKGIEHWFPLSKAERKREEIRKLILDLHGSAS